jgi:hypothetical protein
MNTYTLENCLERFNSFEKMLSSKLCLVDLGDEVVSKQHYWRNINELDEVLVVSFNNAIEKNYA